MALRITLQPSAGDDIAETAAEMVEVARRLGVGVKAEFNGIWLYARGETDPDAIAALYRELCRQSGPDAGETWRDRPAML